MFVLLVPLSEELDELLDELLGGLPGWTLGGGEVLLLLADSAGVF